MSIEVLLWIAFGVVVIGALIFDLGVFQRKLHVVKPKEALLWTFFWIVLALIFNVVIFFLMGNKSAILFLTGYLIEKSLCMDNLFVFMVIFNYLGIEPLYQPRILRWGIIGAIIFRAIFIIAGITLIKLFHWVLYLFGALLIFTCLKLLFRKETNIHPEKNIILSMIKGVVPITTNYYGAKFIVKVGNKYFGTPLLVGLLAIESTDIVFALDSVPAILGITTDPFIVYTSNVFAILGLRALYFFLSSTLLKFHYLNYGLSLILGYIGMKLILSKVVHIPAGISLLIVGGILMICVLASLARKSLNLQPSWGRK